MSGPQEKQRCVYVQNASPLIGTNQKDPNRFYVYVYLDPTKLGKYIYGDFRFLHEPFYVGKGQGTRAYNFICRNVHLKNKLKRTGKPIVILIKKNLSETSALALEKSLTAFIGRKDLNRGPLYNLTDGGDKSNIYIRTEEIKQRTSKGVKNNWIKRRKLPPKKGWFHSEESKRKQSESMKGKKWSEESKKKLSATTKGRKRPPFSEEWKRNISIGSINRKPPTEEARRNMSAGQKGRVCTEETKEKMSLAALNRTEETKRKISENMKRIWTDRKITWADGKRGGKEN
jgi:hypothetical protein